MYRISAIKVIIVQLAQSLALPKYVLLRHIVTFLEQVKLKIAVSVPRVTTAQSKQWSPSYVQLATIAL